MTARRRHRRAATRLAMALAIALTGCGGPLPAMRYHHLAHAASPATPVVPADVAASRPVVVVGPLVVPAQVDRRQWVLQVAPGQYVIDDANGWATPLPREIAGALAGDLAARWPARTVVTDAGADATGERWRLAIDITRLDAVAERGVTLAARWRLLGRDGDVHARGEAEVAIPLTVAGADGTAADGLATAYRDAVRALAARLAGRLAMLPPSAEPAR